MTSRSKAGFTLIEMLVVLAIIALAATALPMLGAGLPGVRLRAEADRMTGVLAAFGSPFCESEWLGWRPPAGWAIPPLPADWAA